MQSTGPTPLPPENLIAWRRAQRQKLIERRMAIDKATLAEWRHAIDGHLARHFPGLAVAGDGAPAVLAICWPYRNEYDARHFAAGLRRAGATIALPVVVGPRQPLIFRRWAPGTAMAAGPLGIPFPVAGPAVTPTAVLLPVAGFDDAGFRLGYGGGYFDRTLAAMVPKPLTIAAAHELARLPTIYPQAHDVPLDYVVTEAGLYRRDRGANGSRLAFQGARPAATE